MNKPREGRGERGGALQVVLLVIAGIVLLAVVMVLVALWAVKRFAQVEVASRGETKRVEVRTPIGEFSVEKGEDAAQRLKLPVYPGAEPHGESASVRLWGRVENEEGGLDIMAAEFRTPDSIEKVDAWYREHLGKEFTRELGHIVGGDRRGRDREWEIRVEPGGGDVLYKHETAGRVRGVALKRGLGWITIGMFEVGEAHQQ